MLTRTLIIAGALAACVAALPAFSRPLKHHHAKPTGTARTSTDPRNASEAAAKRKARQEAAERRADKAEDWADAAVRAAEDERCWQDKICLAERHRRTAVGECARQIEQLADYEVKWVNHGQLNPKFNHHRWRNWNKRILTHIGDQLSLQNESGTWVRRTYECDVDLSNVGKKRLADGSQARVLAVRAKP